MKNLLQKLRPVDDKEIDTKPVNGDIYKFKKNINAILWMPLAVLLLDFFVQAVYTFSSTVLKHLGVLSTYRALISLVIGCYAFLFVLWLLRPYLINIKEQVKAIRAKTVILAAFINWILSTIVGLSSFWLLKLAHQPLGTSANQDQINKMSASVSGYIYIIFLTIIVAPVLEEFIFRYCMINVDRKHKITAIFLSGLAFGALHTLGSWDTLLVGLAYPLRYAVSGWILGFVFVRYRNYTLNVACHSAMNLFATLLPLISAYVWR